MYSIKELNIGATGIMAILVILIWTYIIAAAQPMTLEQQQNYLEDKKNAECPHMPSEEHCRGYYNDQILLLTK